MRYTGNIDWTEERVLGVGNVGTLSFPSKTSEEDAQKVAATEIDGRSLVKRTEFIHFVSGMTTITYLVLGLDG